MTQPVCVIAVAVSLFAFVPHAPAGEGDDDGILRIGTRKQLFVDDYIIDEASGVKRRLGKVTKANGGKPIFTDGFFYGTVLHDEGLFKLWFRKPGKQGYGLATSRDGLKFTKVADIRGINFAGDYTLSVEIDPHETDPAHRFKAAYDAPGMRAGIAHSRDGIEWTPYNDGQPVTHRAADTYNQILWDEDAKTYRLFTRTDFGTAGGAGEVRGTRSMLNPDVRANPLAWKKVRDWIFDREGKNETNRRQIYAVTDFIHHGVHFGILSVYEFPGDLSEGPVDYTKRHERDVMNIYLASSRDGDSWDLSWVYKQKPIIPRGPDGSFDKDLLLSASTIVTHDDRHWWYYHGANERHGTPEHPIERQKAIGLAWLRLDGFVSLTANPGVGIVTTKPFVLEGNEIEVNVDASKGSVIVEVLEAAGNPIPGYSASDGLAVPGDSVRMKATWLRNRNVSKLRGKPIRLRFRITKADLYSFKIR